MPKGAVAQMMEPLEAYQHGDAKGMIRRGRMYPEILIEGPAGTGKSRGVLEYIDACCYLFPGIRVLICRQTLMSLRQSVQVTLEEKVWWPTHPCITATDASREHRSSYVYPMATNVVDGKTYTGKSEIVLGGLDKPSKTFSTEYDIIFVEEGIEIAKDAWMELLRVNRNWKMPWQMAILATNPGNQFHWLNLHGDAINEDEESKGFGKPFMRRLYSRHKDNPCLWDDVEGDWTEDGRDYLENKLGHMTGAVRLRLLEGKWVASAGLIYESFDMAIHAVEATVGKIGGQLVVQEATGETHYIDQVVGAKDFGFRNPGSLSFYGKDAKGYWWHLVQVYRSQELDEWWADVFEEFYKKLRPRAVVADHEPGAVKSWNIRIASTGTNPIVRNADKDFVPGRDCVDTLLRTDEKGIPGIRFIKNNLRKGVDNNIRGQGKPCSMLEEIVGYVWEETPDGRPDKEHPKKENDHAMDELRYFARHVLTNDYKSKEVDHKFEPGSFGAILGHGKRKKKKGRRKAYQ